MSMDTRESSIPCHQLDGHAESILIVDDDEAFRLRLGQAFRMRGYEVECASSCPEAVARARKDSPEMAVIDLRMPGQSGLELLCELKRIDPTTRVVMLTGYGSIATAIEAMRLGATYYIAKPADVDDILVAFDRGEATPLSSTDMFYRPPSLARAEWEHINRVLADCSGNISETARRLGIHRRSLQRKLQKFPPQRTTKQPDCPRFEDVRFLPGATPGTSDTDSKALVMTRQIDPHSASPTGSRSSPPCQNPGCRVAPGDYRPGPSPDPDKEISTIRLLR